MDFSIIVFSVVILYFAFKGYQSGLLRMSARLLSLLAAYTLPYLFALPFAAWLKANTSLQGLLAYFVAGIAIFVISYSLLSFFFELLIKLFATTDGKNKKGGSWAGGFFGLMIGGLFGVLIIWFTSTAQTLIEIKQEKPLSPATPLEKQAKQLTASAVKALINQFTDEKQIAQTGSALIADPAESLIHFKNFSQSGDMQNFLQNYSVQAALNSKNAKQVMLHPSFQALVSNKDLIKLSTQFGFAKDKETMQKQLAIKITRLWTQINQIKEDPEFVQLMKGSKIQSMLEKGELYQLASSSDVEKLVTMITSVQTPEIDFFDPQPNTNPRQSGLQIGENTLTKRTTVYRWTDEKGRVHYSDKKNSSDKKNNSDNEE